MTKKPNGFQMAKVALFLNGKKPKQIPDLSNYEQVFCTDGALHFLVKNNVTPNVVIGDFDSIDKELIPTETKAIHIEDQNTTDFEKALSEIIKQDFKCVDVFGASGLEQDHFLGNLSTALKFKNQIKIQFYDDRQTYWFLEKEEIIATEVGKTLSLVPFPKAVKVNSNGLKYPLNNLDLELGGMIGTRNQTTQKKIHLQFSKGEMIVFLEL